MWSGMLKVILNNELDMLKNELRYELEFCICLGMYKYIYLIQSISVGVVRLIWTCQK